jgi:hypothetical protein
VLSDSFSLFLSPLDAHFAIAYPCKMNREIRGLRFSFDADAELAPESSPKTVLHARVTELSLHGCFLETSASLEEKHRVLLKIREAGESFEAEAVVLYARPTGVGLAFREVKPRYRDTLQNWILKALDRQLEAQQIPS